MVAGNVLAPVANDALAAPPVAGDILGGLRDRLERHLASLLGRAAPVRGMTRFPSGFSWITIGFAIDPPGMPDGVTDLILRLGPGNGLFAPYSAAPQHHVLATLAGTDVPAPRVYGWSDDPSLLGAPFFISERSPGDAPIPWGPDGLTAERRDVLGKQFADILGALHAVAWRDTRLGPLEPGVTCDNAASRQLDSWEANYRRWALRPHPMVHRALGWLRAHAPTAPRLSIVHGDYRLGNFLEADGSITAILDWELVHIGDPHEDLGWACLPQYRGDTKLVCKLIERSEFFARHEMSSGVRTDAASMRFYAIFSLLKLAVTHMAGVSAFERNGFHDMRMPAMGTQIAPVLRQIEKALAA